MTDEQPGFKIQGEFYPWIGFDDWMLPDCRLVRELTGYNETQLLRGDASNLMVNFAFAAVAFKRRQGVSNADVASFFDNVVKPEQIETVGFKREADAGPPDESQPGNEPSESGESSSSETTQETPAT